MNITDVDEFTSPVDIPNDTEDANQASILQFVQDLANRTRFLKNRLSEVVAYAKLATSGTIANDERFPLDANDSSSFLVNAPAATPMVNQNAAVSGAIAVASPGIYRVDFKVRMSVAGSSDAPRVNVGTVPSGGGSFTQADFFRAVKASSNEVTVVGWAIVDLTAPTPPWVVLANGTSDDATLLGGRVALTRLAVDL